MYSLLLVNPNIDTKMNILVLMKWRCSGASYGAYSICHELFDFNTEENYLVTLVTWLE